MRNIHLVEKKVKRKALVTIDYTHICCLFLNKNDRKYKHQQDICSKKLFDLGFEDSQTSHDNVIFNYSSRVLSKSEISFLCNGLNIATPPTTME